MDKILENTLLYDFYGELLTDKQKLIFEMYYQNDLSLSEIGEELSISRQAVSDQLKRTEKILIGYERKLGLIERFIEQKNSVLEIVELIKKIESNGSLSENDIRNIEKIKEISYKILN